MITSRTVMMRLLRAYALGRFCWRLYLLALATFPKGNPNAELWTAQMAACRRLRRKEFGPHRCKCFISGAAKSNSHLLRFTSGRKLEVIDFLGRVLLTGVEPETYGASKECCDSPWPPIQNATWPEQVFYRKSKLETRNWKLETYSAAFPFTTIPIGSGSPDCIFSLLAKIQCSWPSLLTAGTVSLAGCTKLMGPGWAAPVALRLRPTSCLKSKLAVGSGSSAARTSKAKSRLSATPRWLPSLGSSS